MKINRNLWKSRRSNENTVDVEIHVNPYKSGVPQITSKFIDVCWGGFFDFVFPSTECAPFIQVLIIGKGNATFLGNFDVLNKYCFDGEQPVGPIYGFLTAANGDQIFTQMIGAIEVPAPEISYFDYIILGGTGRFEGASGAIQMFGTIDRVNSLFNLEGEGEITF